MKLTVLKAAATAVGVTLALSACGGGEGPAAAGGPTTLTVSVWNYEQTPEFKALFDAFEAANEDIDVQPVDILADDYPEKVTTMLAGGDTTDVITMKNVVEYARYAGRGQLQEVGDVAEAAGGDKLAGLDDFDLDGSTFAVPYRQDFWLLYYNKALFDAAGLPHPERMTWSEYRDLAQRLTAGEGEQKVFGTYHHTWRSVVQSVADAQSSGDQLSGDYDFFAPQYDVDLELQESGAALDYATAAAQKTSYRTMFETGRAAMLPMGTWYIAGIKQAKDAGKSDVEWGMAPLPQRDGGDDVTTFGSPTAFAVNKNAKNTEAAKRFLEFAAGEEGAKAIAAVGVVPAYTDPEITEAFFQVPGLPADEGSKEAFEPGEVVLEMPVSEFSGDVDTILNEEHQLVMVGEKSVTEGIAAMEERVRDEVLG
ncbi:multiple sugar transport system substrate-binding protein [Kineococcus xinjiangensis]|uniref:Multiple sugar transport system substrate-binding protein n=1 Tax=Kineococcus xinjiangensis TaxID=512762 RepID=A0A2S6IE41_9ACTN|nr:sugar ABC transporter substrate-binding protein [Kineococcus xinjiangensis]PPK92469.1 multiple sugar transport system substrate-binding protein [Kineococcus xinjiangensis]